VDSGLAFVRGVPVSIGAAGVIVDKSAGVGVRAQETRRSRVVVRTACLARAYFTCKADIRMRMMEK